MVTTYLEDLNRPRLDTICLACCHFCRSFIDQTNIHPGFRQRESAHEARWASTDDQDVDMRFFR
jgi:hypothetical protein